MKEKHKRGITARESSTSCNIKKHSNKKKAYTDGSKCTGRKIGFTAVIVDITRRVTLPDEASIYTAEMTAMREIQKKD